MSSAIILSAASANLLLSTAEAAVAAPELEPGLKPELRGPNDCIDWTAVFCLTFRTSMCFFSLSGLSGS